MIDVEKLNALVDNELDPAERAEVQAMLATDPQSAAQVGSIKQLKNALQDHVRPVACEDEWKGCIKRLNEIDGVRRTKSIVDRWAWAMCSVLFVFIVTAGLYNRVNPGASAGTGQLSRAGMEKPVRDVYHWLKNEVGMTPDMPLHIVSATRGTYDERPVANLHLRDSKGDLSLVVVGPKPDGEQLWVAGVSPMDDGNHYACQTGEATSVVWKDKGIVMQLTGKRDANELRDISNRITWQPTPR